MADVGYLLNEAEDAVSDRQWDLAIEKLQKVLQQDPHNEEACDRLAKCFAVRGLLTQVINQYFMLMDILESRGDFDLSVEVGNWILKLQPENDKARMRMILVHRRKGDTSEVVRQSLALARVYMELNQGDQSILLLQEVSQNDPNNLEIGMELAEMYINQGLIQDGAMQLGKIANMLLEQGQLEKAAEAFRRMKLVTAEDPNLSFTLGNIYVSLGKLNEAEAEFRQILRHNLNHLDALTALGGVCQQKGQFRDAMLAFNKILSIDPQQVVAKEKLGELYQAQGNLPESIKQYLAAGQQYQTSGNPTRAVTLFQRVVSLDPANPVAVRELGNLGAPLEAGPDESSSSSTFPQPLAALTNPIPDFNAGRSMPTPGGMSPQEAAMPMAPPQAQPMAPPVLSAPPPQPDANAFMQLPQPPSAHQDPYAPFNAPTAVSPYTHQGFDAMTEPLPPLPDMPVGAPEAPPVSFNWSDTAEPAQANDMPLSEPTASPRGLRKKTTGQLPMPGAGPAKTKPGAASNLVRKPGMEKGQAGGKASRSADNAGAKPFKRSFGEGSSRPSLPDRNAAVDPHSADAGLATVRTDSGRLSQVKSLLEEGLSQPAPEAPTEYAVPEHSVEEAANSWPAENPTPGWPSEPAPTPWPSENAAGQWPAEAPPNPWGPPAAPAAWSPEAAAPAWPTEAAPAPAAWPSEPVESSGGSHDFGSAPPPPPSPIFDSGLDIPAPPSFDTDGHGDTLGSALAGMASDFSSPGPMVDFHTPPMHGGFGDLPPLPPLNDMSASEHGLPPLPAGGPAPLEFHAPSLPWETAPPAPEPESHRPAPPPLAFASPTQRLNLSDALTAALAAEMAGPPPAEPVEASPSHTPTIDPTIMHTPLLPPRELPPPPHPLLMSPVAVRPADAPLMPPPPSDTGELKPPELVPPPAPDAVDVTRLHDYIESNDLSRAFAAFHKGLESAPANRELRQHLAQTYFQNGMLDEALSEFEALVEADPQNVRYRQQLAESAMWTSDLPRSVNSMLGYANCLQREGSYDEAVAVLEDCVALDPHASSARLVLADLHTQLNMPNLALYHLHTLSEIALQRDDAEGTLQTLRRLYTMTGDPIYQQRLASALVRFGHQDEAVAQFRELALKARSQGDLHNALYAWQQVLLVHAEHEEALDNLTELYRTLGDGENYLSTLSTLARMARQQGKVDRSRMLLETIVSADPRRMDVRKELVEVYLEANHLEHAIHEANTVIEASMQSRDYQSAIDLMTRLAEVSPDNLGLREQMVGVYELMGDTERVLAERINLGQAYTARGQSEEALRVYEKALAIDENNTEVHYLMGNLYADARHDLLAAEAAYERVFELDPQHVEAMKRLIAVLMQRDEPARAVGVLNRLIDVAPENKPLREQFLAEYQKKVDSTPDDVKSRFTLGVLYLELNQHDKSIEQFQKTRPFKAFTLKSYNMLGLAFSRKAGYNSDDLAIKQFKKGLELTGYPDPEVNELRWNLGQLLERKGKPAEALDVYKEIYSDDVGFHQGELGRRVKALQDELGNA